MIFIKKWCAFDIVKKNQKLPKSFKTTPCRTLLKKEQLEFIVDFDIQRTSSPLWTLSNIRILRFVRIEDIARVIFTSLHIGLWEEEKKGDGGEKMGNVAKTNRSNSRRSSPVNSSIFIKYTPLRLSQSADVAHLRTYPPTKDDNSYDVSCPFRARFPRPNFSNVSPGDSAIPRDKGQVRILHVRMMEFEETCSADAYLELLKLYFRIKSFSRWQCDAVDTMRSVYCVWRGRMLHRIHINRGIKTSVRLHGKMERGAKGRSIHGAVE